MPGRVKRRQQPAAKTVRCIDSAITRADYAQSTRTGRMWSCIRVIVNEPIYIRCYRVNERQECRSNRSISLLSCGLHHLPRCHHSIFSLAMSLNPQPQTATLDPSSTTPSHACHHPAYWDSAGDVASCTRRSIAHMRDSVCNIRLAGPSTPAWTPRLPVPVSQGMDCICSDLSPESSLFLQTTPQVLFQVPEAVEAPTNMDIDARLKAILHPATSASESAVTGAPGLFQIL